MQALQNTLEQIWKQVRELSSTAKMLIGSMMVILLLALFLIAQYAGGTSMEPLGLQPGISSDARGKAVEYLRAQNIPYRERGGEIHVPVDRKYTILARLTDNEVITPNQIDFDTLIEQDSPFLSRAQNERRWLNATMNVLGRTIASMNGIDWARVVIDEPKNQHGIGRAHLPASASVTVRARRGLEQNTVDAIAEMVAGAHAGLEVEHVRVIDAVAGRVHRARKADQLNASSNLEVQLTKEQLVREKIAETLAYIPGVNVAVSVTVDTRQIIQQRRDFDEPKLGVTGESSRIVNTTNQTGGREAGVRPNTGANIRGGGGRTSTLSDERTDASMIPFVGNSDARITDHRSHPLLINSTIGVPKSYFVRLYQDRLGDEAAQPEPEQLDALVEAETERIRSQIEPLIDTRAVDGAVAGTVMVSMIPDFAVASLQGFGGPMGAGESGAIGGLVSEGLVKTVGLLALAIVSLAMMFMLVRKASVREELPTPEDLVGVTPALRDAESELVGEAGETPATLDGVEVDEDDLRRQQMLSQINELASQTPAEAAGLVRRWMKSHA
ncbi:MAG: hypothetical protein EA377_05230 [Phycisphaerales bacterium]|nr:MAG: hypothetical protein EA377_05230 [Phycisphaerales bacterium]